MLNVEDADDAELLTESQQYLADNHVLAMLEMGLEEVLRDYHAHAKTYQSPVTFLAAWLMRNNPKRSERGADRVRKFMDITVGRDPLPSIEGLEASQQEAAALRMQSAARGHAARLFKGEQVAAATTVQAASRGRKVRRVVGAESQAASRVQASYRGHNVRREHAEQSQAATRVQASYRGRSVRARAGGEAELEAPLLVPACAVSIDFDTSTQLAAVHVHAAIGSSGGDAATPDRLDGQIDAALVSASVSIEYDPELGATVRVRAAVAAASAVAQPRAARRPFSAPHVAAAPSS